MKKTHLYYIFIVIFSFLVLAVSPNDDAYYCSEDDIMIVEDAGLVSDGRWQCANIEELTCVQGGNCYLSNLTVAGGFINITVQNVTINSTTFLINGTDIDDLFLYQDGRKQLTNNWNYGPYSIYGEGNINITSTRPTINLRSNSPFGISEFDLYNNLGYRGALAFLGSGIPQSEEGFGGNSFGLISFNTDLTIGTLLNKSIRFGSSIDNNTQNLTFIFEVDPSIDGVRLQGSKLIRTVPVDGGNGLLFQSLEALPAGGFPFIYVAQDSNNDTIVTSWQQNGRNNSFSGNMNSLVLVPKPWVKFTGMPLGSELSGVEFLFNASDYIKYCDWLQENLSLMPEGCQLYADTTGRGVPMMGVGDLEVVRSAYTHESLTAFNDLDFIGRNGNDVDFLFNGDFEYGKHHIRDIRQITANISSLDRIICDFDDATICDFISESIAPETGRDWDSVLEIFCHQDRCANAKGGNTKVMCFSEGTQNANNISISFWLTSVLSGGDIFQITLDDNQGNTTIAYSTGSTLNDQFQNFTMPGEYNNKTNVTMCFELYGQNANRQVWVDIVRVQADFTEPTLINETFNGGRTVWGQDRGILSCAIDVDKQINNDTLEPEWVMRVGCPDGATIFSGNSSFENLVTVNSTILGDQLITGDLTVYGSISEGNELLINRYLYKNGSNADETININDENLVSTGYAELGPNGDVIVGDTFNPSAVSPVDGIRFNDTAGNSDAGLYFDYSNYNLGSGYGAFVIDGETGDSDTNTLVMRTGVEDCYIQGPGASAGNYYSMDLGCSQQISIDDSVTIYADVSHDLNNILDVNDLWVDQIYENSGFTQTIDNVNRYLLDSLGTPSVDWENLELSSGGWQTQGPFTSGTSYIATIGDDSNSRGGYFHTPNVNVELANNGNAVAATAASGYLAGNFYNIGSGYFAYLGGSSDAIYSQGQSTFSSNTNSDFIQFHDGTNLASFDSSSSNFGTYFYDGLATTQIGGFGTGIYSTSGSYSAYIATYSGIGTYDGSNAVDLSDGTHAIYVSSGTSLFENGFGGSVDFAVSAAEMAVTDGSYSIYFETPNLNHWETYDSGFILQSYLTKSEDLYIAGEIETNNVTMDNLNIDGDIVFSGASLTYTGTNAIGWSGGSKLYEQTGAAGGVDRMIYQPNGDRFDVLTESGGSYGSNVYLGDTFHNGDGIDYRSVYGASGGKSNIYYDGNALVIDDFTNNIINFTENNIYTKGNFTAGSNTNGYIGVPYDLNTNTWATRIGNHPTLDTYAELYSDRTLLLYGGGAYIGYMNSAGISYVEGKQMALSSSGFTRGGGFEGIRNTIGNTYAHLFAGLPSTNHSPTVQAGRTIIIADADDASYNFQHEGQINPTVFIHSNAQSTDEWISLTHNGTDGIIDTGKGGLYFTDTNFKTLGNISAEIIYSEGSQVCTASNGLCVGGGSESNFSNGDNLTTVKINTSVSPTYLQFMGDEDINIVFNDTLINYVMCYQEYANISTSCGGRVGSYNFSDNANDGNYGTTASTWGQAINYTKPYGAQSNSLWQIDDDSIGFNPGNFSIPESCWNYDENKLLFSVLVASGRPTWNCFNGTWNRIRLGTLGSYATEEAMHWNISNVIEPKCLTVQNSTLFDKVSLCSDNTIKTHSPDGTEWSCGVDNSGTWSCS